MARWNQMVMAARPRTREELAAEQERLMGGAGGYADTAEREYLNRATNFDASKALNTYATGAYSTVAEGLKRTLADVRGRAVGAGRFDTGFLDEDQGTVIKDTMADFNNRLSQQALAATGMQQENDRALGEFGQRQRGYQTDLLMSRREELENNAREEAERKRKRRGGIGGAIGGLLGAAGGFVLGGPAGAAGGWKAGSAIGSGIANW